MSEARKAAIRAYKERKASRGVFAVRCGATSGVWVESAPDIGAAENRVWFALQHGDRQMEKQAIADFAVHGRDAFTFEVLEILDADLAEMAVRDTLKEKKRHWMAQINARSLWPV